MNSIIFVVASLCSTREDYYAAAQRQVACHIYYADCLTKKKKTAGVNSEQDLLECMKGRIKP